MYKIVAASEADTERLGAQLASHLFGGAFVALFGELGAGKTAFVRGAARIFQVQDITSPTFTIMNVYESTPLQLIHVDAYRLQSAEELQETGFEEFLHQGAVVFMEWPQHVASALPKERLDIQITGSGMQPRTFQFVPHGEAYVCLMQALIEEGGWSGC
ncbi:tRNA (adenosine(37)-N6)-threonylcarbamoyltransferase complex ATPase subunit type 1 TsaE [Christensenellaceae bacterium OttesenSCG-928-L17]|nr:tRNA (adenosine(37)-N6)-threonylcarbamoyltransferase complex ATPase subunit type 1 TsaE [Christensenellaceae bacterium OttesenSCG-928-L17]